MMRLPFKPLLIAGAVLTAPLLGACHGNVGADDKGSKVEFTMKNGSLTLRKRIVIVKVSGHDPAYITTHGHLVIGSTNADEVPTNDEQRAALAAYNKAANGMIDKGIDVGVEGAHVAADAIGIVIKDAVNGKTQDIDKDVKKGVEPIKGKVDQLCNQLDTWRQAQADVARLIPVFEPYAIIGDADIKDCREHGFIDDDDNAGDKDKNADKDSDDEDDDDSDKPSSPGAAVHDSIKQSIHDSLSKSFKDSATKSDKQAPPAAAASVAVTEPSDTTSTAGAETTVMKSLAGTWVMADDPSSSARFTVKLMPHSDSIILTLPQEPIHLSSGQDVTLSPCQAQVYCSPKDFSPAVRFEMASADRATLSVKGHGAHGYIDIEESLRHQGLN